MTPTDRARVEEIEARCNAATLEPSDAPCVVNGVRHESDCACLNTPPNRVMRRNCNCGAYRPYVQYYRTDIPWLIAQLRAASKEG
jgi:hypothetical protein